MRFAISFSPIRALRLPRNISNWPLALRFLLLTVPVGVCIALAATWLGYRAASTTLRESLESLPLLEAKMQAERMGAMLTDLRHSLLRIAQDGEPTAQSLADKVDLFFQDNARLVQELGFKTPDNQGFILLRDKEGFKTLSAGLASQGPYSPFQQLPTLPLREGAATLYSPVYFDDPSSSARMPESRSPVMRMALHLGGGKGTLILGISIAEWRNTLAASMQADSPLRMPMQDGAMQLAFFFDTRGWILFEMDGSGTKSYLPDLAREGYRGDVSRPGYDSAFRPWAAHENYWRMVTEVMDGRSGSVPAPPDKYAASNAGNSGFLCFAPVLFTPTEASTPMPIGGIAFFETSSLPMAAFLRFANYSVAIVLAAVAFFGLMAYRVSKKLALPLNRMADELADMTDSGELAFVHTDPACQEQQRFQAAVNTLIAGAIAAKTDLERTTQEMRMTRSRLPVDLSQTTARPMPTAEFGLVGSSPLIAEVRDLVRKAARAGTDVLVWGETGTGKELVAAAIHKAGKRSAGAYISINCGALDENLLLDALFGHVKGAFTEAKGDRKGAFLAADGGTLHLDEIANASLKVQQALLRALSVRRIRPLGTDEEIPFNTRVVAATNVDLRECVRTGAFREDLYYRLAIISIQTPPLRHRKEDIPELAAFCIHDAAASLGRPEARLSRGALERMYAHDWPGNVREFKNCLTRAMAFAEGDLILPQHITLEEDAFGASPLTFACRPPDEPGDDGDSAAAPDRPNSPYESGNLAAEHLWPAPPRERFTTSREDREVGPLPGGNGTEREAGNGRGQRERRLPAAPVQGDFAFPPSFASPGPEPGPLPLPRQIQQAPAPLPPEGGPPLSPAAFEGLNERQQKALVFVREQGEITRSQYESVAGQGLSARTAQNDLRELVDKGILQRMGAGPGTRYILA